MIYLFCNAFPSPKTTSLSPVSCSVSPYLVILRLIPFIFLRVSSSFVFLLFPILGFFVAVHFLAFPFRIQFIIIVFLQLLIAPHMVDLNSRRSVGLVNTVFSKMG